MEQNHGGKNDKRTKVIHPNKGHLYAESNAVAIKAIYYGINMNREKSKKRTFSH